MKARDEPRSGRPKTIDDAGILAATLEAINQSPRVEPEWVSLREAAKIYAISTYTLRRRIASGDLPAVKLGYKLIRVRVSDLDRLFR